MTSLVETLTINCRDPRPVAEFWCAALGYELEGVDDEGAWLRDPTSRGWPLLFSIVPEGKSVKTACTSTYPRLPPCDMTGSRVGRA